jgi:hypothetical protein
MVGNLTQQATGQRKSPGRDRGSRLMSEEVHRSTLSNGSDDSEPTPEPKARRAPFGGNPSGLNSRRQLFANAVAASRVGS